MSQPSNQQIIEALLFTTPLGLKVSDIASVLGLDKPEVKTALAELQADYEATGRAFELVSTGGGYLLRTKSEYQDWIQATKTVRPTKLSPGAMETLAIVAYHQPVTRSDIEEIRGVDCSYGVKSLLEKGLIRITGKKDAPGRPMIFGTSKRFLEVFGIKKLAELPRPEEYDLASAQADNPVEES